MPSFNKVFLIGNLTHDPELNETPAGTKVATFGVAANRKFHKADGTSDERTCFVDIVVWDRLAETCAHYLKKGKRVFIEGRLEYCVPRCGTGSGGQNTRFMPKPCNFSRLLMTQAHHPQTTLDNS